LNTEQPVIKILFVDNQQVRGYVETVDCQHRGRT